MTDATSDPITVMVVEDQMIVAEGLKAVLTSTDGLTFAGMAATVQEAIELAATAAPQVVLMDFQLPDGEGTDAARSILDASTEVEVIMLTGLDDAETLAKAVAAGCCGFVSKSASLDVLLDAISRAAAHDLVLAGTDRAAVGQMAPPSSPSPLPALSATETEVLKLLADGMSTSDIVQELMLPHQAMREHIGQIMEKLGAKTRLEAVAIGLREGLT